MIGRIRYWLRAIVRAVHEQEQGNARGMRWLESVAADIRFAFRFFARKPLASATIVIVLAVGIAAYAAVFGLLQSAMLRPPPGVPDNVPLVLLRGMVRQKTQPHWSPRRFSYPELREMRELRTIFSAAAGWTATDVVADMPGALDHTTTRAYFVTDDYFDIVGVHPSRGSALPPTAPGRRAESQLAGVISDAMWEDAFARKDLMNRTVMVNGVGVRIVGVAPPEFNGVLADDSGRRLTIWLPLATRSTILAGNLGKSVSASALSSMDSALFQAVGRLQPGVSPRQATAAVRVVAANALEHTTPASAVDPNTMLVYDADVAPLRGWAVGGSGEIGMNPNDPITAAFALLGTVATLLLLVVCTNVAALVIGAAVGRRREIAVRLSLGASRHRVIRQLLTESTVLSTLGGALGFTLYWGMTVGLSRVPAAAFFRPDLGTVAFTACVALGTGMLCGLAPALHATRTGVGAALKDTEAGATRRSRLQHAFVVAQVMFTQPLLVLIAMLIGTVLNETTTPLPAGSAERVLRLEVDLTATPGPAGEKNAALERLLRRLAETPGVVSVLPDPVFLRNATIAVRAEDSGSVAGAGQPVTSKMKIVTAGYFALMGAPLIRGSDAAPSSDTSATMIIGSDLARQLFGEADPIGRRFVQISPSQAIKRDLVVTGVYDSRYYDRGNSALVFRAASRLTAGAYLIRTARPASDLVPSIRRIVRDELPSTPIASLLTLAQIQRADTRNTMALHAGIAASGALVLLLSSIGLYGAVALAVGQRRREIGVRMALGARAAQVVALFYGAGVRLGIVGLVLGLPLSLAALSFVFGRSTTTGTVDTMPSFVRVGEIIGGITLVVASAATLIPATRAARVNPVTALRSE